MEQAPPITPFDLNVLGTPPAFILSQDQTLKNIVSNVHPLGYTSNLFSSLSFFALLLLYSLFKGIVEISLSSTLIRSVSITFCALYLLSLFNFQGPSPLPLFRDSLTIISPLPLFVNTFFQLFLRFFSFVNFTLKDVIDKGEFFDIFYTKTALFAVIR